MTILRVALAVACAMTVLSSPAVADGSAAETAATLGPQAPAPATMPLPLPPPLPAAKTAVAKVSG
jgi:hypothetical protein